MMANIIRTTPAHVAPLYADTSVPAVQAALDQQAGSKWPTVPCRAESSWNGWVQRPRGIEYMPAVTSSGPAKWARWGYEDLPRKYSDAAFMLGAASHNSIMVHSTFASPKVMVGFRRALKSVTGVQL